MTSKTVRLLSLIAAVGFWSAALAPAWAEADDPKALAAALKDATATLQGGLKASEREGTPISAKFEIEDGKLQLSVYTMKDDGFMEVVAEYAKGTKPPTPPDDPPPRLDETQEIAADAKEGRAAARKARLAHVPRKGTRKMAGEEHETASDDGLTALVIEAPGLRPR